VSLHFAPLHIVSWSILKGNCVVEDVTVKDSM
jgi:hypothetical protein